MFNSAADWEQRPGGGKGEKPGEVISTFFQLSENFSSILLQLSRCSPLVRHVRIWRKGMRVFARGRAPVSEKHKEVGSKQEKTRGANIEIDIDQCEEAVEKLS